MNGLNLRRSQNGAIAVMTAVTLGTLLLFTVLAIDTGRLYWQKRTLQQQADLAAMQAAQIYCSGYASVAAIEPTIRTTLQDHNFNPDDGDKTLTVGLGTVDVVSNRRSFSSGSEFQAVQVVLTHTVPASLFAGSVFNDVTLSATGVAERDIIATLAAGNALLSVDSQQSDILDAVLGGLLNSSVNLSALGYNGLIASQIKFGDLIAELNAEGLLPAAAGLTDLSNLDLTLGQLLSAISNTLTVSGAGVDAISAVNDLASAASASGADTQIVDLNNVLAVDSAYAGSSQALESSVPTLQLINSSLLEIRTGDTIDINLNVATASLPIVSELFGSSLAITVSLTVDNAPNINTGRFGYDLLGDPRTLVKAAGLSLAAGVHLDLGPGSSGTLNALLGTLLTIKGDVYIAASTIDTEAWLDQVSQCPRLLSRQFDFTVGANPGIATAEIRGANPGDPANLSVDLTLGLGLVKTTLEVAGTLPLVNGSSTTIPFSMDLSQPDAFPSEYGTGGSTLAGILDSGITSLGDTLTTNISATLLGLPITLSSADQNTLTSNLLIALDSILSGVAELALDPLLDALGISIGAVRVQVLDAEEGQGQLML